MQQIKVRIKDNSGDYITKVTRGNPVELMEGFKFIVHRNVDSFSESTGNKFRVSEVSTGWYIGAGSTKKAAIENAKAKLDQVSSEYLRSAIDRAATFNETHFKK